MTQDQTYTAQGDDIYDSIMEALEEPDLMTKNLDGLEERYKDESEIDRDARMERYASALKEADRILDAMSFGLDAEIREAQRQKREGLWKKESKEHDAEEAKAEKELESFDDTSHAA